MPVVRTDGRSGGRSVGRCTVTWLSHFLGWVDYFIFLPMVLRWRASRARAPLKIAIHRAPRFLFLSPSFPATQRGLCGRESCRAARVIYKLPRDLPSVHVEKSVKSDSLKWRIQGRGPGTRVPPSPPLPPSLKVWIRHCVIWHVQGQDSNFNL